MARTSPLIKILVAVGVLAVVGVLFIRSARSARSAPYTVEQARLRNWTAVIVPAVGPTEPVLVLQPPPELVIGLFGQVFSRAMESLSRPAVPGIPLVLKGELDRALAGRTTAEALAAAARSAGLEAAALEPKCLAYRRVSEPRGTWQLYFVIFDEPAFGRFREQIGTQAAGGGVASAVAFDPAALSPVLFVAASDPMFSRWLPLRADPQTDCVAPIAIR